MPHNSANMKLILLVFLIGFIGYFFSKKQKIKPISEEKKFLSPLFLNDLTKGQKAVIQGISEHCDTSLKNRLLDLGFVKGSQVSLYMNGPLQNPKAYFVQNTAIVLRNEQAKHILISISDE